RATGAKEMHASCEPLFRSTRREGSFSCKTEESEVAEPRTTVQSWSGLWKDDWNKGVEARASAAISRQQARQGTRHFLGKLTGESKVRDAGLLTEISIVTPPVLGIVSPPATVALTCASLGPQLSVSK